MRCPRQDTGSPTTLRAVRRLRAPRPPQDHSYAGAPCSAGCPGRPSRPCSSRLSCWSAGPGLEVPDATYTAFYRAGRGNVLVTVGLHIVPFAGIAFLWNMSATRTLIEAMPGALSEMPRWLQLGSGIVRVPFFTGTAAVGAVALLTVFSSAPLPPPDVARP